jgi:hypothetical protein
VRIRHATAILPADTSALVQQLNKGKTFMNEPRNNSILQRVPVILAVTAASYGLPPHSQALRKGKDIADARRRATHRPDLDLGVPDAAAMQH